jgi:hypothetical protein
MSRLDKALVQSSKKIESQLDELNVFVHDLEDIQQAVDALLIDGTKLMHTIMREKGNSNNDKISAYRAVLSYSNHLDNRRKNNSEQQQTLIMSDNLKITTKEKDAKD